MPKVTQLPVLAEGGTSVPRKSFMVTEHQAKVNKTNLPVTLHWLRGYKNIVFIEHLFQSAI